ncbi:hypothetical protein JCM10003_1577 [Bacteroides pyogenes JCM 10003]|nr:hypothetical protein JCM10003_1577 [Bacteroides pyogenes JCM 10003]
MTYLLSYKYRRLFNNERLCQQGSFDLIRAKLNNNYEKHLLSIHILALFLSFYSARILIIKQNKLTLQPIYAYL